VNCPNCGRFLVEYLSGTDRILWTCTNGDYAMEVYILERRVWRRPP
jgi:hypothetical protein